MKANPVALRLAASGAHPPRAGPSGESRSSCGGPSVIRLALRVRRGTPVRRAELARCPSSGRWPHWPGRGPEAGPSAPGDIEAPRPSRGGTPNCGRLARVLPRVPILPSICQSDKMQFFPRRHAEASRLSASWPLGRPAPAAGPPPLDFRPRPGRGFPAALGDIADVGSHPADRP